MQLYFIGITLTLLKRIRQNCLTSVVSQNFQSKGKLTIVFFCNDRKSLSLWFSALKTKLNATGAFKLGNVWPRVQCQEILKYIRRKYQFPHLTCSILVPISELFTNMVDISLMFKMILPKAQ